MCDAVGLYLVKEQAPRTVGRPTSTWGSQAFPWQFTSTEHWPRPASIEAPGHRRREQEEGCDQTNTTGVQVHQPSRYAGAKSRGGRVARGGKRSGYNY